MQPPEVAVKYSPCKLFHQPGDMRQAIDEGKEKGLPEFEALEALGVFIDPVQKFLR